MATYDNIAKYYNGLFTGPLLNLYYNQSVKFLGKYLQDNFSFLDVGCGTGAFLKQLYKKRKNLSLFGVDESQGMIKIAQKNHSQIANFQTAKAENLPFGAASINFVSTVNSFALFEKEGFANECRRVLKPGGFLFINTIAPEKAKVFSWGLILLIKILGVDQGSKYLNLEQIKNLLQNKGFELIEAKDKVSPYLPIYKNWLLVFQKNKPT